MNSLVTTSFPKREVLERRDKMKEVFEKEIELLKAKLKEFMTEEEYKDFLIKVEQTVYDEVIQYML